MEIPEIEIPTMKPSDNSRFFGQIFFGQILNVLGVISGNGYIKPLLTYAYCSGLNFAIKEIPHICFRLKKQRVFFRSAYQPETSQPLTLPD